MPFQCPKCGLHNTGSSKNCAYCSASLDGAKVVAALHGSPSSSNPDSSCLSKAFSIGCASVLGLLAILMILSFMMAVVDPMPKQKIKVDSAAAPDSSPSPSAPSTPSKKQSYELEALAVISDGNRSLSITNMNDFTWKGVTVEVNGGAFSGGYKKKVQDMKFLDVLTIDLRNFAKKDGTRFNPYMMKVNRVMIEATTPKGKKFYVGDFE